MRRDYETRTLTEADPRGAFALQVSAKDDLISIMEEFSFLSSRKNNWLSTATGQLEHASSRPRVGPRNGPAGEEIAGPKIAAVAGVMREHLSGGPVHVRQRG